MPEPDITMRHAHGVDAPPDVTFAALSTTDFGTSGLISLLFTLRSIPAMLLHPMDTYEALRQRRARGPLTLERIEEAGFGLVAERPGEEIVLGVTGKFWESSARLIPATRELFTTGPDKGNVLVAWNFLVEAAPDNHSRLSTETRIVSADVDTRLTFKRYWLLVHPGSALIRRSMLSAIAREAVRLSEPGAGA